jgi:hypothetical protein
MKKGLGKSKKTVDGKSITPMSRRQAFRQMMARMVVLFDEAKGQRHYSIRELESLEREQLETLVPVLNRSLLLRREENWMVCLEPEIEKRSRLFEITKENMTVFGLFNGRRSLAEITESFKKTMGAEDEPAWEQVKKLFFLMLSSQACGIVNLQED